MSFSIAISKNKTPFRQNIWLWLFIAVFSGVWLSTLLGTTNMSNWMMENVLTILFLIFLVTTFRRFQFSDLTYLLICVSPAFYRIQIL